MRRRKRPKYKAKRTPGRTSRSTSGPERSGWEYVSKWYDGMVGDEGSQAHALLLPKVVGALAIKPGDRVIDVGCGQGVLAPHVLKKKGRYTGIDVSNSLIKKAKERAAGDDAVFHTGDAHNLKTMQQLTEGSFDSA